MPQYSEAVRNAGLDARETAVGTTPILRIRTGAAPANTAAADTGTVLVEITLPSDWMAAASGGSKAMAGSWSGTATAAGTAAHYRIYDAAGTTCHIQGAVGATGSGSDMEIDDVSISINNSVAVTQYTVGAGNA